jgi:putative ABC transport system permease protein
MNDVVSRSLSPHRFRTLLLSLFAALALALAGVGIYGVMAYSVAQRSHEIGIRMALGAEPGRLRLFVIGQGLKLALFGVLIGIVLSIPLTHFLSSVLYGVRPTDAPAFAGSFLFLILITLLAAYIPARRATRVDPVAALRAE